MISASIEGLEPCEQRAKTRDTGGRRSPTSMMDGLLKCNGLLEGHCIHDEGLVVWIDQTGVLVQAGVVLVDLTGLFVLGESIPTQVAELLDELSLALVEGLRRHGDDLGVEVRREPVAQHALDEDAQSLDVEPVDEDVGVGGLGEAHELHTQRLLEAGRGVVLALELVDELLGIVEVTWDELLLAARRHELVHGLLEQVHVVQEVFVILLQDAGGAGHDVLGKRLVAGLEVALERLGHRDQHRCQVLRVQDEVLGLDDVVQRSHRQVTGLLSLGSRQVGLSITVVAVCGPHVGIELERFRGDVMDQLVDRLIKLKLACLPMKIL